MLQIGYIKSFARKGDRVTVYFPNGRSDRFVANNDLTSTKVVVMGDRVFSEDAAQQKLVTTTRLFKSKTGYKEEDCKLVPASLWTANKSIDLPNGTDALVLDVAGTTWSYDSSGHSCLQTTSGAGVYSSAQECLIANSGRLVESFGAKQPFYLDIQGKTYRSATNNGYRLANVFYQRTHVITTRLNSLTGGSGNNFIPSSDLSTPNVWLIVRANNRSTSFTFTDGSINPNPAELGYVMGSQRFLDLGAPGDIATFVFVTTYTKVDTASNGDFNPLPVFTPDYNYINRRLVDLAETPNFSTQASRGDLVTSANGTSILRDAHPIPLTTTRSRNYFIKSHDPDLPPFLVYSTVSSHRPYFIFLGDLAYFIVKIGKIPNPSVSFSARTWQKIKVISLKIGVSSIQITDETDYDSNDPNFSILSNDAVLKSVVTRFIDNPENDPTKNILDTYDRGEYCIRDGEYYLSQNIQSQFIEVSYQKKDGKIIEYKLPGVLRTID